MVDSKGNYKSDLRVENTISKCRKFPGLFKTVTQSGRVFSVNVVLEVLQ